MCMQHMMGKNESHGNQATVTLTPPKKHQKQLGDQAIGAAAAQQLALPAPAAEPAKSSPKKEAPAESSLPVDQGVSGKGTSKATKNAGKTPTDFEAFAFAELKQKRGITKAWHQKACST